MIHYQPQRKPNRLKNFDYSKNGWYFVTICTKNKEEYFGMINNRKMILNQYGNGVKRQWLWLEDQYPYVKLDEFQVMPNHFHGIIIIDNINNNIVGTTLGLSLQKNNKLYPFKHSLLSKLICAFKTTSSKSIHQLGLNKFQWQRSYYDHIIRNEVSLKQIREYIRFNPIKWEEDEENPKNLKTA